MSKDNGKEESIVMIISLQPGKEMRESFPLLGDSILTYGFLKQAEKQLDKHYAGQSKAISKIIKPDSSSLN